MERVVTCGEVERKLNNSVKFKNLSLNESKNEDVGKVSEKICPNIGPCPEVKPCLTENDVMKNVQPCEIDRVVTIAEKKVCDCNIPSDNWAPLSRLTRTRPTVDNLTITRYSPGEWSLRNKKLLTNSSDIIRKAKNIKFATNCIEKNICDQIDRDQQDTNISLKDRTGIIFRWKIELEKNNQEVTKEIYKTQNQVKRLLHCQQAVKSIKDIDTYMERTRRMRMEPDLVHDSLSEELHKEESLCTEVINLYIRCVDEVKMQLRELKDSKQRLEYDWSDKTMAYEIDTACIGLRNDSATNQWKPGCVKFPPNQSTEKDYEKFFKESLAFCQTAVGRSRVLRANLKMMLEEAVKDLRKQADRVEHALSEKINDQVLACRALERALTECLQKLADSEGMINKTSSAIKRLDAPMKCAQSRLGMRLTRDRVENCRDDPQFGLIEEVKRIGEGATALSGHIKSIEESIDELTDCRKKLEQDLIVKRKSLWIDRDRCRLMRVSYPSYKFLNGYM